MIRDITIGQYYPAKSVLHRLDPRTKFLGTLGFLISVFLFHTFLGYAVATVFLVAMIAISKVPVKFMFKGLKAIVMILLITVVFNIILTPGEVLWRFGIIKVTKEGLVLAGRMAIRLVYLVIGSSIMTLTTTPNHLTDGLERLLRPLNKIHVPVHEIAMMISIALRFIPTLIEETQRIMKAQALRNDTFGVMSSKKTMELNPDNAIVKSMLEKVKANRNDSTVKDLIWLLYDTSLLTSGFSLEEPVAFANRIHKLIKLGLSGDEEEEMPPLEESEVPEKKEEEGGEMEEVD